MGRVGGHGRRDCNCSAGRRDPDVSAGEFGEDVEGAAAVFGRGGQVGAHRGEVLGAGEGAQAPETFCLILAIRMSRSAWLLSNGTRGSVAKPGPRQSRGV